MRSLIYPILMFIEVLAYTEPGQFVHWAKTTGIVARQEATGIFTRDSPGKLRGKEEEHIPVLEVDEHLVATITVPETSLEDGHFTDLIYAKDQDGEIVAGRVLSPTDTSNFNFFVTDYITHLTAFQSNNVHGVWKSDTWVKPSSVKVEL